MELQLKHIAPYLPYGLTGVCTDEYEGVETVKGISIGNGFFELSTNIDDIDSSIFKPLLLPLSCLTEEITVDGETFVPIVELAKIHDGFSDWFFVEPNKAVSQGWNFYYNMEEKEFQLRFQGQRGFPNNIYEIYLKIHEWHFDVFNLIDAGLAIDKRKHLN